MLLKVWDILTGVKYRVKNANPQEVFLSSHVFVEILNAMSCFDNMYDVVRLFVFLEIKVY